MPAPEMNLSASHAVLKAAEAEVTVVDPLVVAPSVTAMGLVTVAACESTTADALVTDAMYVPVGMPQPVTASCASEAWKLALADESVVLPEAICASPISRVVELC